MTRTLFDQNHQHDRQDFALFETLLHCDHDGDNIADAGDDAEDDVGDVKDANFVPILYLLPFLGRWSPCDKHCYYIRLEIFDNIIMTVMTMTLIR